MGERVGSITYDISCLGYVKKACWRRQDQTGPKTLNKILMGKHPDGSNALGELRCLKRTSLVGAKLCESDGASVNMAGTEIR